jgi:hypothetical protein
MDKVTVNAELIIILDSKNEWIRKIPNMLPQKKYYKEDFLWVDKNDNQLVMGEDFSAAEEMDSYPVRVYRMQRVIDVRKERHP